MHNKPGLSLISLKILINGLDIWSRNINDIINETSKGDTL